MTDEGGISVDDTSKAGRSRDRLHAHYLIERELASRLMNSTREERRTLYSSLYDELFRRVPDHPQLLKKTSPEDRRKDVDDQMELLGLFLKPDKTMMEIGPGDCALSMQVCRSVKWVYAVDVSAEITKRPNLPPNFELSLSDGVSIPRPPGGAHIVFSNQLMEHLHPDDASEQLRNVVKALAPGGVYVCITPNRLMGPHDISQFFSETAQGFHLKEYSASELLELFTVAGFSQARVLVKVKGRYYPLPGALVRRIERRLERAHGANRKALGERLPYRLLSNVCIIGTNSRAR